MLKGFRSFLMQGELIVIAVGLVVALAFSTLIKSFTDNVVTPLVNAAAGGGTTGQGIGWTVNGQRIDLGAFIAGIIYFLIVVPYRAYMARRGTTVFGEPAPMKTCPSCLSSDLPVAASRCLHCTTELATPAAG
jgi:large conductance mechanosensitive channel